MILRILGILGIGVIYHIRFMRGLRRERDEIANIGLIPAENVFPTSLSLVTSLILLAIGLAAMHSSVLSSSQTLRQ